MKMKLVMISAAVTTALMASSAIAADGTIFFEGALSGNTCDITIDGKPTPTVTLPTVRAAALQSKGATAGDTLFKIVLTNCFGQGTTTTTAAAFFENGSTVDYDTFNLKNTASGVDVAENVQLQLLDAVNQSPINIGFSNQNTNSTRHNIASEGEGVEMPYVVRYYATEKTTPGLVESQVNFSIDYE